MRHWKKKPWVDSEVRNWDYIADHIAPDATIADAGKVLTVGETGKPEWGNGGGSGGGGTVVLSISEQFGGVLTYNNNLLTKDQFDELYANNAIIFYLLLSGGYSDFGYVAAYDDSSNGITIIEASYDITNDEGGGWSKMVFAYDSINDRWVLD